MNREVADSLVYYARGGEGRKGGKRKGRGGVKVFHGFDELPPPPLQKEKPK